MSCRGIRTQLVDFWRHFTIRHFLSYFVLPHHFSASSILIQTLYPSRGWIQLKYIPDSRVRGNYMDDRLPYGRGSENNLRPFASAYGFGESACLRRSASRRQAVVLTKAGLRNLWWKFFRFFLWFDSAPRSSSSGLRPIFSAFDLT